MSNTGKLILIVGPSGVGKGTLVDLFRAREKEFYFPPSVTTRAPRPHEVSGVQYEFVTPEKFTELMQNGDLLEWAIVHETQKYGTLKQPILDAIQTGKIVMREVDVQGLISIREKLPPEFFISIFIAPPDLETLRKRILRRGKISNAELAQRLASAEKELAQKSLADHEVVSEENQIENLYTQVWGIIERARNFDGDMDIILRK